MSLPSGFKNSYEYFCQVNEFLIQNAWIYKEANTNVVKADVLSKMPQHFQDYFTNIDTEELNKFPYVHDPLHNSNISDLIEFRQRLAQLIPWEAYNEPKDIGVPFSIENVKRINLKKQHEIQRLAAILDGSLELSPNASAAEQQPNYVIIDLGSGLGYLSEMLLKLNKNISILGLEAEKYRVEAAEKRKKTYMPTATSSIHYRQHFITENSTEFIAETVKEVFKLNYVHIPEQTTTKMVIIGLHACADLSITSMQLFLQMPHVQQLIIMPCCYHKLQVCDNATFSTADLKFKHFPLSQSLKQVLLDNEGNRTANGVMKEAFTTYLNRPFLRLACQQTLKRWSKCTALQHQVHGVEMFLRAVAEALKPEEGEIQLQIVKRKEAKFDLPGFSAEQLDSFETFSRCYALKGKTSNEILDWSEKHSTKFFEIMKRYPNGAKLAEGLTCLQTTIQKLCENLVLYDRLCFLEEMALAMNLKVSARYEKIMDESLSPRCYVLIAKKLG